MVAAGVKWTLCVVVVAMPCVEVASQLAGQVQKQDLPPEHRPRGQRVSQHIARGVEAGFEPVERSVWPSASHGGPQPQRPAQQRGSKGMICLRSLHLISRDHINHYCPAVVQVMLSDPRRFEANVYKSLRGGFVDGVKYDLVMAGGGYYR